MGEAEKLRCTLEGWFAGLENEKIPAGIVAANFGLFETLDGYSAYLTGSSTYEAKDDSWASNEDYVPKNKYFALPQVFAGLSWREVQSACKAAVESYLARHRQSQLHGLTAVTIGFDDGDLEHIL